MAFYVIAYLIMEFWHISNIQQTLILINSLRLLPILAKFWLRDKVIFMKGGLFVSILDIRLIFNCSERSAQRHHSAVRKHFNKTQSKITVKEFAEFFEISEEEVKEYLNDNRI